MFQRRTSLEISVKGSFNLSFVLPVTRPSVSEHWRKHKPLTLTSVLLSSSFLQPSLDSWQNGGFAHFTSFHWCPYHGTSDSNYNNWYTGRLMSGLCYSDDGLRQRASHPVRPHPINCNSQPSLPPMERYLIQYAVNFIRSTSENPNANSNSTTITKPESLTLTRKLHTVTNLTFTMSYT